MYKSLEKAVYWRWDRSSRYIPVIKHLKSKYGRSRISILEVGCGDYSMGLYDGYKVDGVDIREPESKKHLNDFIKSSILDLSIPDRSYDVVICVDFLEHLPKDERYLAIDKMLKITRRELVMVFPEGAKSQKVDSKLYSYYKKKIHPYHLWFEEHVKYGLPKDSEITQFLLDKKASTKFEITKNKICDLKMHFLCSKFLMDKNYYVFLAKNKLLLLLDFLIKRFIKSNNYYRSMYLIELD